jgi:nucleoid DNA-binding protein
VLHVIELIYDEVLSSFGKHAIAGKAMRLGCNPRTGKS